MSAKSQPPEEIEVEIYPGASIRVKVPGPPPKYALMSVVASPSGKYQIVPCIWSQHVRMSESLPEKLGLAISPAVFYRLLSAAFVECSEVTPNALLVDLSSLLRHLRRTRRVPGKKSWWTPERIDLWKASRAGVSSMIELDER